MHAGITDGAPRDSSRASDVSLLLLQELDQFDRQVIILRHLERLTVNEIARVLSREVHEVEIQLAALEARALRLAGSMAARREPSLSAS